MRQKSWDDAGAHALAQQLLEGATDEVSRERLLASTAKESRAWLHALPISSLGSGWMSEDCGRIASGCSSLWSPLMSSLWCRSGCPGSSCPQLSEE